MGRFFITNDAEYFERAETINELSGLNISGCVDKNGLYIQTYEKRAIKNKNILERESGGYIISTGTLIYDGNLGYSALANINREDRSQSPNTIRKNAIGHYSLIIIGPDGEASVSTDPKGAYEIYYYSDRGGYIISNSLMTIAYAVEASVDECGLINKLSTGNILDETFYSNVRRLLGSQQINVSPQSIKVISESLNKYKDWQYSGENEDEILTDYIPRIRETFDQTIESTNNIGVHATAGLDTRTILAGLLHRDANPILLHGLGDTRYSTTSSRDTNAAEQYAELFDLDLHTFDRSFSKEDLKAANDAFEEYGFRYTGKGVMSGRNTFYRKKLPRLLDEPYLIVGGFSPAFTVDAPWEKSLNFPIDVREFVEYQFNTESDLISDDYMNERLNRIVEKINSSSEKLPVESTDSISKHDFVKLSLHFKLHNEAKNSNLLNEFCYVVDPFLTYQLMDPLIDVPPKYRESEKVRIKLLEKLCKDILDVPVHSGSSNYIIDMDTYELKKEPSDLIERGGISIAKNILPKEILNIIRPIYRERSCVAHC